MIEINRNEIRQTGKTEGAWRIQGCSHGTERARRRRWSLVREGPHAGTDTATRQRRHAPARPRGGSGERGRDQLSFRGAVALYGELLVMAHRRVVAQDALYDIAKGDGDTVARLRQLIDLAVASVAGMGETGRALRLLGREFQNPSSQLPGPQRERACPQAPRDQAHHRRGRRPPRGRSDCLPARS